MKIVDNILHTISRVGNRFVSIEALEEYRRECAEAIQDEYNGTYEDGPDLNEVDYSFIEMNLADRELARRRRQV